MKDRPNNVLEWLDRVCPEVLSIQILAFTGPQSFATAFDNDDDVGLMRSKKYNTKKKKSILLEEEETWRLLCQDLHRVCNCCCCVVG